MDLRYYNFEINLADPITPEVAWFLFKPYLAEYSRLMLQLYERTFFHFWKCTAWVHCVNTRRNSRHPDLASRHTSVQ